MEFKPELYRKILTLFYDRISGFPGIHYPVRNWIKNAGLPTIYGILHISVYRKKLNIRASLKIIGTAPGTLIRKNTGICCFSDLNYLIFFIPRLFITVIQTASALPGLPTVMSADTW